MAVLSYSVRIHIQTGVAEVAGVLISHFVGGVVGGRIFILSYPEEFNIPIFPTGKNEISMENKHP